MSHAADGGRATLEREGALLGRYLVGEAPPRELVARYADACRELLVAPAAREDVAVLAFVRRHPWSLGPLDAAAGLRRPGGLLRAKVLVMAAILEASPRYAEAFLPRDTGPAGFFATLAWHGAGAVLRALVGLSIWPLAVRPAASDPGGGHPAGTGTAV